MNQKNAILLCALMAIGCGAPQSDDFSEPDASTDLRLPAVPLVVTRTVILKSRDFKLLNNVRPSTDIPDRSNAITFPSVRM